MFLTEPSKVYFQWQGNNMRIAPLRLETLMHRGDHSNLPEKDPVTIRVADIQDRVLSMKSWTASCSDIIHT